jgi:threonine synthase
VILCSSCALPLAPDALACPACGGVPECAAPESELSGENLRSLFRLRLLSGDPADRSGVWRFRELLPELQRSAIVTLGENRLPLHRAVLGADFADAFDVHYLHAGANPTGSFKDAGMTAAISQAKARGRRVAVCASTGNTSSSMAAYSARAGMRSIVVVPAGGVSEAKLAQTLDYGARVVAVDGDFDVALRIVRGLDARRVAVVNSINPYRIEGQKCAAFVMLEMLGWKPPDWIVLPGGNLGNASAFGKGIREAIALGLIERPPRLAVVQAEGAAPFVRALESGEPLVPVEARTAASAIRIGDPASWQRAAASVRSTGGTAIAVSDEAIADARAAIGRDGIGCEPASAASLAGLKALRERGTIAREESVVLVLTGHMLKDGAYAAEYHAGEHRFSNPIVHGDAAVLGEVIERALAS